MIKKKIILDLDVITVAEWDKKEIAIKFINRVKFGEFEIFTPYSFFDLLDKWKYEKLKKKIKRFYELYSEEIITPQRLTEKLEGLKINEKIISNDILRIQVKEEDILLVIITSMFNLDYLVTMNRKHLKNKMEVINDILQKHKLNPIKIVLPDEI